MQELVCCAFYSDLHSNLPKPIACKDRLWLLIFRPLCCILRIMLFLTCPFESSLLVFTWSMKMRTKCWYKQLPWNTKGSATFPSLICSWVHPWEECMWQQTPLKPFPTSSQFITFIRDWSFRKTWDLELTTLFSLCVLWIHCWNLFFLPSQLPPS